MRITDKTKRKDVSGVESRIFGTTKTGAEVTLYTIQNEHGLTLSVIDYGATIVSLRVPDKEKQFRDVVLGYDSLKQYEEGSYYFGAVIGRNANRISNASCVIDKRLYELERNEYGNNLHSGSHGFHTAIWKLESGSDTRITLAYESPSMEQGFPGTMLAKVTYELTKEDELLITYEATSDEETVANFTNHAYFNLNGHAEGSIEGQYLSIYASYYTPVVNKESIPTGDIKKVLDTPMDFRREHKIGDQIEDKFDQLQYAGRYDHNYVLDKAEDAMQLAAVARSKESGIVMEVYTTCPGIQFYTGNFIDDCDGKDGAVYHKRQGFCLETQYFPNAINEVKFPSPLLSPGEMYQSTTAYHFLIK